MKKILAILGALGVLLIALPAFATSYPVGGSQYYLAGAGVNATATNIQLTALKTPDGRNITMAMVGTIGYGALEPQTTAKIEDVTFTGITQNVNGTATLTGVSRGMDFVYPYSSTVSLEKSHSGGATFIITNTAGFYYGEFAMPTLNNVFTYPTASTSVATKGYADSLAFNGAAVIPATTLAPGVSQLATQLQTASSTATNGGGYSLVVPSQNATSTFNANTSPLRVVVTQNSGKIDPYFIATSSLGLPLFTDIQTFSTTTSGGTWTKPVNTKMVELILIGGGQGGNGGGTGTSAVLAGASGSYIHEFVPASLLPTTITVVVGSGGAGAASGGTGTVGGNTAFGSYASAVGGAANTASTGMVSGTLGGSGGTGSGPSNGGAGTKSIFNLLLTGGIGGTSSTVTCTVGGNGLDATTTFPIIGGTGGGGGAQTNSATTGCAGGNGGQYGAGGGAGGDGGSAGTGGAGGRGGDGVAEIISYQ